MSKSIPNKYKDLSDFKRLLACYRKNNMPIILKTCQLIKKSSNVNHPDRAGRFNLDELEHKILKASNGYYLFIVLDNRALWKAQLINANDINCLNISHTKVV